MIIHNYLLNAIQKNPPNEWIFVSGRAKRIN